MNPRWMKRSMPRMRRKEPDSAERIGREKRSVYLRLTERAERARNARVMMRRGRVDMMWNETVRRSARVVLEFRKERESGKEAQFRAPGIEGRNVDSRSDYSN